MKAVLLFSLALGLNAFAFDSVSDIEVMQVRSDGAYDVVCANGNKEVVTDFDIHIGNVCPNQTNSNPTGIASLQKLPDGRFNVVCKDKTVLVATADDIMAGKVCQATSATNQVDFLWVIGGMTERETYFQIGIKDFMTNFTAKTNLDWRMAVIGDDILSPPFLGMPAVFDKNSPTPIQTFVDAVTAAIYGRDSEVIFDPIQANLTQYPSFLRPSAKLVIIVSNDAPDVSVHRDPAAFLNFLKSQKGGDISKVSVFGIIGATDLGCRVDQTDGDWHYAGSEFETVIKATNGTNHSLCDPSLSDVLAQVHADVLTFLHSN